MSASDRLAKNFDENRKRLLAVAYRMLGSRSEADDAVQEAWIRLTRSEAEAIENLGGWLTTVVSRICLDLLRSRKTRAGEADDSISGIAPASDPETDVLVADSVGSALLVLLEALAPAERVAFVLHDLFDLPFEEIAPIVGKSAEAARQSASRARRRIRGVKDPHPDSKNHRHLVAAFLAASRNGDFAALLALLDPNVVLRADPVAVRTAAENRARGAPAFADEIRGAEAVANTLKGRAQGAQLALLDGEAGAAWLPGGVARVAFVFTSVDGRISRIDVVMDPERLGRMSVAPI